jgi:hypothetical protein
MTLLSVIVEAMNIHLEKHNTKRQITKGVAHRYIQRRSEPRRPW